MVKEFDNAEDQEKIKVVPRRESKRIADLDGDEDLIRANVMLPESWYKDLGDIAHDREVSKGSLVREALREWFAKEKRRRYEDLEEVGDKDLELISDKDLEKIFSACKGWFGGFRTIEEDNGFFDLAKKNGLKLENLTHSQFIEVAYNLKIGYDGFSDKPEIDDFMSWVEELSPTEYQAELLRKTLEHEIVLEEADKVKSPKQLMKEIDTIIRKQKA